MSTLDEAFEAYEKRFGELHALYQLRFFGDEQVIEILNNAVNTGIMIDVEELEKRLPGNIFY